jgi:hypothetical protein
MTVMRDEMNCPMAETINKMSDQNLQGIILVRRRACPISEFDLQAAVNIVWSANAIDSEDKEWCCCSKSEHDPDELQVRIDQQYSGGLEEQETNIELIKGGKTNDDVRIGTLCLDMAKKDREADEDVNEENVGRRRAESTNEEDPGVGLDSGGEIREKCERIEKGRRRAP